ncbi:methyltransferase domain-containing protein [Colletotrichum salicis]|uniref:Methyltransferase domain-containing protein n=1 Tax=Colletotrichum salicis TaxID=1209931 RepID=A0A135S175_9PEZI|nr:methyltransferase domain-containing protein [Colletotrichum salicis]
MSSPGSSSDYGGDSTNPQVNPLDNFIPRQSQLARFEQEHPQNGNILVPLSHNTRNLRSAIDHHKDRATRAIKSFQQSFTKAKLDDSTNSPTDKTSSTGTEKDRLADAHTEASVIGVDLSPIQPTFVPPNYRFEIDDLEKEWTWTELFDFILIRSMWTQLVIEATNIVGKSMIVAPTFKQLLEEAGFEDVQGRQDKWSISPWQQNDSKQRELGVCCRAGTMEGLEPICMALFTRVLGWTQDEVVAFCAGVREELTQQTVHGYFNA